jgi:hypothetical protein
MKILLTIILVFFVFPSCLIGACFDFNNDDITDLKDVIIDLQILTNTQPITVPVPIPDIDKDNKTGLAEVVYLMQLVSTARECEQPAVIKVPSQYSMISEAVTAAKDGDIIEVSAGLYSEKVLIGKSLILKGSGMFNTEINGGGADSCDDPVLNIQHDNVTISGFRVSGGYPGIEINGKNSIIKENHISNTFDAVPVPYCPNDSPVGGGMNEMGILVKADNCTIHNNLIVKNSSYDGEGAGIKAISVNNLDILNNTVSNNSGANGASCGNGYGIRVDNSNGKIINNIITNNDATGFGPDCGVFGYGIYCFNCNFLIDYNNVWDNDDTGGGISNYFGIQPGSHDISADPLFINMETYQLQANSPCINSGDPDSNYSNEPSPNGKRIDIGAYGNTSHAVSAAIYANAGTDKKAITGSLITLDGSSSNGEIQSYKWTWISKPAGSNASLSAPNIVNPIFTADVDGIYQVSLVINDGFFNSEPDTVIITAAATFVRADAGSDQNVVMESLVTLDGSASSSEIGEIRGYEWSFVSKPDGSTASFSDPNSANPIFTADIRGVYVISLIVSDEFSKSKVDTVQIATVTRIFGDIPESAMVLIKGGTFQMGGEDSDAVADEKPVHNVTVSDFNMGAYEVTQEIWVKVMRSNPSRNQSSSKNPVEQVSRNDIDTFITKLNQMTGGTYRLPTEAEWEYAAKGGSQYKYGTSDGTISSYRANYNKNVGKTSIVGCFPSNPFGIYDMSGNIWEWVGDWYDSSYYSQFPADGWLPDPLGPSTGTYGIIRGGSMVASASGCRTVNRFKESPSNKYDDTGFRLVKE